MANFNKITLIGTLISEVEEKTTTQGHNVSNFQINVSRPVGPNSTANVEKSDVFTVICWNELASKVANFSNNTLLLVEGRINTRTYDTQDGVRKWVTEIEAKQVTTFDNNLTNTASNTNDFNKTTELNSPFEESLEKEPEFNFDDAPADIAQAINHTEENNTEDVPF